MWGRVSGGLYCFWYGCTLRALHTVYAVAVGRCTRTPQGAGNFIGILPWGEGGRGGGQRALFSGGREKKKTPTNPVFIFIDIKLVSTCCTEPFGLPGLAPNELKYKTKSRKPEKIKKKFKIQKIKRILKKKSRTSKKNQKFFLKKGYKKVFFSIFYFYFRPCSQQSTYARQTQKNSEGPKKQAKKRDFFVAKIVFFSVLPNHCSGLGEISGAQKKPWFLHKKRFVFDIAKPLQWCQ